MSDILSDAPHAKIAELLQELSRTNALSLKRAEEQTELTRRIERLTTTVRTLAGMTAVMTLVNVIVLLVLLISGT
jgi:chemotaxis protein histidine kinase CheA